MMNSGKERTKLINRENQNRQKNPVILDHDAKSMIVRFKENIDNIESRFHLYNHLINQNMKEEAEDILRFQIVYLMSALDLYMHELYSYGLLKVFNNQSKKSYRYKEYKVPLKVVEYALFDGENIVRHLKELLIEQHSTYTFMHPNRIKELLNTISHGDTFSKVEKRLRKRSILNNRERLYKVLDEIYDRRNKISHQTDINHGKENRNKVNRDQVKEYSDIITAMVEEFHYFVCEV